jgi:hypothetical protein
MHEDTGKFTGFLGARRPPIDGKPNVNPVVGQPCGRVISWTCPQ